MSTEQLVYILNKEASEYEGYSVQALLRLAARTITAQAQFIVELEKKNDEWQEREYLRQETNGPEFD